jgi:phosphoglycerate-specific signal transduction histidine kinase
VPAARQPWLDSAARWIELLLGAANRYRMAADLHLQAVHADHRELMAKHAALAESEQRYRTLSAELEDRVLRQVALIEQSQRRMYETEKMASIGNLAAGMAHEINNPMGFVRSNLTTAKSYVASLTQAIGSQQWDPARRADLDDLLEDFQALIAESLARTVSRASWRT